MCDGYVYSSFFFLAIFKFWMDWMNDEVRSRVLFYDSFKEVLYKNRFRFLIGRM